MRRAEQYVTLGTVPRHLDQALKKLLYETVLNLGTQAAVANSLRVDQATVSRWLAGSQGMDIGQVLRLAKLTNRPVADILRWSGHDPEEYLESGSLPSLSTSAQSIADRARLLLWERRRLAIPIEMRPMVDNAIEAILTNFEDAYIALSEAQ